MERIESVVKKAVKGRRKQYGDPKSVFPAYGKVFTGLLAEKLKPGAEITGTDVAILMVGLKLCRLMRKRKRDTIIDAHGYLKVLERIEGYDH